MRSKISFFNKGLFFSNLKRFSWAAILETIVMFFCFPYNLMTMDIGTWLYNYTDVLERRSVYPLLCNLTICVYAVVLAVMLFQYLHKPKMTTALHGLPLSRATLFFSTLLSGMVLLFAPILFTVLCVFLIQLTMEIGAWIVVSSVLRWMLYALLLSLVLFVFTTFVGMFVGNVAAHFVFTYILHFLPIAVYAAFAALGQMFLRGFSVEAGIPQWILELPMMTIGHEFIYPCGYYFLLYALMSIAFGALAFWVYTKRPLERAGDIVVFTWLRPVFKYGVSVCFAVTGFLYIVGVGDIETYDNMLGNTLIAMLWAFVGFCIAQMLIVKSWRIFGAKREMFAVCVAIGLLFVAYQSDITGFEARVPESDSVASVYVSGFDDFPVNTILFETPENIDVVTQMHQALLDEEAKGREHAYMRIEYKLKNGQKMYRFYDRASYEVLACMEKLSKTQEAKRGGYYMFYDDVSNIKSITLRRHGKSYYIIEKQKLAEAIRADLEAENKTETEGASDVWMELDIEMLEDSEPMQYSRWFQVGISQATMPRTHALLKEIVTTTPAME